MKEAKVKDYPHLIKRNGGVINTDHNEYARAKTRQNQTMRITKLENQVGDMQGKLGEILSLLNQLAAK